MGNDGGSIPKRRELVKEAAATPNTTALRATLQEHQQHAWTTCPLSHRALEPPIVADALGTLYNKDALLAALLPTATPDPDAAAVLGNRITSLKDIVDVTLTPAPPSSITASSNDSPVARWICPISAKPLGPGPGGRAVYLVPCGHVFHEAAVRAVAVERCPICETTFAPDDVIAIAPGATGPERERLEARIARLAANGLTHSLRKASGGKRKKRKEGATEEAKSGLDVDLSAEVRAAPPAAEAMSPSSKPGGISTPAATAALSTIKNAATAQLTARVLAEEQTRAKRRKTDATANVQSLFTSSVAGGRRAERDGDFMTRGFHIPAAGTARR